MLKIPHSYNLCSAEQSRFMDEKTISEFGIDGFTLMEIAGTRAADFISTEIPADSQGIFFCGKGNNGGDALAIARLLSQQQYHITVCFLSGTDDLSADAEKNYQLLQKLDQDIEILSWDNFTSKNFDFIVDGMLGTGLNSDVRAPYSDAIQWINEQDLPVFALDVPTGLNADSGQIMGTSVQADFTLSFGTLKTGFYLNDGFDISGEVILCELSFPNKYKDPTAILIDEEWVETNTLSPDKRNHKYADGVLYLIAGSEGLTGASILAARSAWSAGLGAVVLITPNGLLEIYEKQLEQIIKKPVGSRDDMFFKESHLQKVMEIVNEKPGKLLIGPGLGRHQESVGFIQKVLQEFKGDAVIDADALFALSEMESWEKPESANWLITPHPGELKEISRTSVKDDLKRLETVKDIASKKNITILSKGMPSIVATSSGSAYLTGYDTRVFSRAGFGDVLAGKAAAFWILYGTDELACLHAMIDGYNKSTEFHYSQKGSLEPTDII